MKKISYILSVNGKDYNIVKDINLSILPEEEAYQIRKTDKKKTEWIFTYFPLFVKGKFSWLKKTKVKKTLFLTRYKEFDSGWTYLSYWSDWKKEWRITKII